MRWSAAAVLAGCLTWSGASEAEPPKGKGKGPAQPKDKPAAPSPEAAKRWEAGQKGLAWLEQNVLSLPDIQGTPTVPFTQAFTGLCVLLDAGDYAPSGARAKLLAAVRARLGDYLTQVERRVADPSQLPGAHGVADSSKLVQYVWPLSLSAWLHAECALRDLDATAARAHLRRVAKLLDEAQMEDGGWGHGRINAPATVVKPAPKPTGLVLSGYPPTLVAPTNCAATAIAFLDAALPRPASAAAKRAVEHYRACILSNGNFPYDIRQRTADRDLTGVGRTAGALVAMHALGVPHDDATFSRGAAFLREHWDAVGEGHGSPVLNLVFGALAARLLGPDDWAAFQAAWIPPVLAKQAADGALDCACTKRFFGCTCDSPADKGLGIASFAKSQTAYVTALTTFVLLLERGLPHVLVPHAPGERAPGKRAPAVTPK
jgi:hypothetical protein